MKKIISKTFGLRDGEIFISFLMQLYIFIIITVLLIVKPTVNALFISELGADSLPFGYLLVAITAVFSSYFYSKAIRKFSLVKITVLSLIIISLVFFVLGIILNFHVANKGILYFYYVFVSLFAVVSTSQFWIFANMVFNSREAKRIFGFIGAGAIAGGIFGGYLTSFIASNFGNEYVIFIASILILFCIPIIRKIYTLRIRFLNVFKRKQVIEKQDGLENSSLKLIYKSKHLTYIALITGISVLVAKLVDFQFSDFANKAIPDSDDLAAFFGFWFSTFNVFALVVQLFFTNKIVNRLGVSSTLLILPLSIGLGGLLFLTFPELLVLVIIKGIDGSFKQSINKAAIELSIMPIPLDVKNQAKSFIDVVVDSIATGFAGFLLMFFIIKLDLSTAYITVIVLFFVFIWILLIYRLREAYFDSFKKNIQKTLTYSADSKEAKKREINLSDIKIVLKQGNESAVLNMLDRLKDYKIKDLQKSVILLLEHPSNKIKIAALEYLEVFDDNDILEKVLLLVNSKDDILVYKALEYILGHSPITEHDFFNTYLDHHDEYIANGALLALAKKSENNYYLRDTYYLKSRLESKIKRLTTQDDSIREKVLFGLLLSIAYSRNTNHYSLISKNLKSPKPTSVKFATTAAGITSSKIFITDLLNLLENKRHRESAIIALKSYGPKIIEVILLLDKNDEIKSNIRKYIPKIVGAFENENALKILIKFLDEKNSASRLAGVKALKRIKRIDANLVIQQKIIKKYILKESAYYKNILEILSSLQKYIDENLIEDVNFNNQVTNESRKKLAEALELELNKSFKILFYLLSLYYNENDIEITFNGVKSDVKEAKMNSYELLDNILEGSIKAAVLPIIEHVVFDEDKSDLADIKLKKLLELEYLKKIMTISGSNLRQLAVEFIQTSKNTAYIPALLPIKKFRNKTVKKLATETYAMLKKVK
ncbi:Npt1/Npt2 family nucleotide transporter [Polaribacter glomeratus]|uniref:ADP,ATP carrier protein n=1 Tax=Polaribacter glomeratus TaxID=102 RepID=A0A2S7WXI4_9FLAO|nr:Npt1/Npt2 family nucleotide transporter [Polaribacter glomeratus]PQJ82305.1 MFS transporter [Polaribacter glomeratus]TXD66898.1 MFS transporter [Polaribacter glomeratus]